MLLAYRSDCMATYAFVTSLSHLLRSFSSLFHGQHFLPVFLWFSKLLTNNLTVRVYLNFASSKNASQQLHVHVHVHVHAQLRYSESCPAVSTCEPRLTLHCNRHIESCVHLSIRCDYIVRGCEFS